MVPQWLALLWTCALVAVVIFHWRHLLECRGERRLWHAGHVLMGVGMVFMFAPASIDHLDIPAAFWQLVFANASAVVVAMILTRALEGRKTNILWLAAALELGAMTYMWLGQTLGALSWVLVGYFLVDCAFWAIGADRWVDGRLWIRSARRPSAVKLGSGEGAAVQLGGVAMALSGGEDATTALGSPASLVCDLDVRASLATMAFGMAYMLAAMVLAR